MKPNDVVDNSTFASMSQTIKQESADAPVQASEALDFMMHQAPVSEDSNSLDANSLMFDLNELLKRDPNLSSLNPVKEEEPELILDNAGVVGGGVPIPNPSNRGQVVAAAGSVFDDAASSLGGAATSVGAVHGAFGGSSVGSNVTASPLLASPPPVGTVFAVGGMPAATVVAAVPMQVQSHHQAPAPPGLQSIRYPLPVNQQPGVGVGGRMEMDTTPPPNTTIFGSESKIGDVDFSDYFTNDSSRNVSLCPQQQQQQKPRSLFGPQLVKTEIPTVIQQHQQQPGGVPGSAVHVSNTSGTFLQPSDDNQLLFSSTSFGSQSGGATFASSKDLLSSSVPASILQNSPLSDILTDLSPSGPGGASVLGGGPGGGANSPSVSPNLPSNSPSNAGPERHSTLHKLLLRKDPHRPSPVRSPESRNKTLDKMKSSLSASNPLLCQQLSKSAPSNQQQTYLDRVLWSRREPRQHISSVCSVGEASSVADEVNDVLSGLSPSDLPDIESDDETEESANHMADGLAGLSTSAASGAAASSSSRLSGAAAGQDTDDDEDSEDDEEGDDDLSASGGPAPSTSSGKRGGGKKDRHFWQYNVQAKGPKGQRIVVSTKIEDPHVLNDIVDPVFSGDVKLQGIKHSGKARRGDGNDLTPNAKKLAAIGKELDQLSKVINDLTPVSEMPFNTRCKSRKEKNKLASRACRLKKKAQHEANKLKCNGLENEHYNLSMAISRAKEVMLAKMDPNVTVPQADLTAELDNTVSNAMQNKVAGETTEFVNRQIQKYLKNL